jgi:tRNA (mo5U34)-methyltransferase
MPDYLDLLPDADHERITALREVSIETLRSAKKGVLRHRLPFESVRHLNASLLDFASDVVTIGRREDLDLKEYELVLEVMRGFMPWRKGPYNIFGIDIDAEWRSCRKWDRVLPFLPDLENKVVADIGASNGYYMFRMIPHRPRAVVGFEPYLQHYFTFQTLNTFAGLKNLYMELFGVEHLGCFTNSFDVVFLMGILYHRISPLESLKAVRKSLKKGGTLIVESQAIPGAEPVALFPERRYAKAPGTYFIPTAACLKNWMLRAGFVEVEIFCSHPMSSKEQRRTEWMEFESYDDFIDPDNPALTVEGYPAPLRVFLKGLAG